MTRLGDSRIEMQLYCEAFKSFYCHIGGMRALSDGTNYTLIMEKNNIQSLRVGEELEATLFHSGKDLVYVKLGVGENKAHDGFNVHYRPSGPSLTNVMQISITPYMLGKLERDGAISTKREDFERIEIRTRF